jgi:hypothetical protein
MVAKQLAADCSGALCDSSNECGGSGASVSGAS